ncbi:MAG: glycosyltransferase family 9 protein [Desulfovibrio sp.]|jgi:heptosyltransferase-1|nr:glycosyltransferase family 9 protein [Mailhella sp.]
MPSFSILCLRCDRIGDMLVSTPVLHRLRVLYPDARMTVVASPLGAVALEGNPDIDRVCIYDKHAPASWFSLLPCLLARHDLVVNFNAASRTLRILTALSRGKVKGMLNKGRLAPWSGRPEDGEHYSGVMLRELEAEFSLPHDESPDIRIRFALPPAVEQRVRSEHPPLDGLKRVGIFIGNIKKQGLRWPAEKFAQLTQRLLAWNSGLEVYIIAGKSDAPLLDAFSGMADPRMHTFIGDDSLQGLAAFLKTCDAFVTCTSAPQHLAGAMGVPTVSITYPWSERLWTPRGPLNFSAVSEINDDVRDIPVRQVYETLDKTMQGFLSPWQE